jgi:hypothetical protein
MVEIRMQIKFVMIKTCFGIMLTSLLGIVSSTTAKAIELQLTNRKLSVVIVAQAKQRTRYESVNAAFKGKYKDVFVRKSPGKWVEYDENGKIILWKEVTRNDEYVMLFNPKNGKYVRLHDGIYFFKSLSRSEWIGYSGKWIK